MVYHVQHLAPSNSVCRGALLVFPGSNIYRGTFIVFPYSYISWGTLLVFTGSNIYRGTFLVFPYSNISWGTLLVFPDTNLCSKILLHTILWGKCQQIWENPKCLQKSENKGILKSITNPKDLIFRKISPYFPD